MDYFWHGNGMVWLRQEIIRRSGNEGFVEKCLLQGSIGEMSWDAALQNAFHESDVFQVFMGTEEDVARPKLGEDAAYRPNVGLYTPLQACQLQSEPTIVKENGDVESSAAPRRSELIHTEHDFWSSILPRIDDP
jgi:hypothetical protein